MISSLSTIKQPDNLSAVPPASGSIAYSNPFTSIPKLSRNIALLITILFLLATFFPSVISYIALVPGRTLGPPFLFYNLLTSSFLEITVFSLGFNVVSLLLIGKQLEPLWSSLEFAKFIGIVSFGSGIMTYWSIILLFFLTNDEALLFNSSWFGFTGISSALLVGIKQIDPDREFKVLFCIPVKIKFLPLLALLFSLSGKIMKVPGSAESLPFVFFGIYVGWMYLRFFKRSQGVIGDQSESFGLESFFPSVLSVPIRMIGNVSYKLVGLTGFWKKFSFESQATLPTHQNTTAADAQRRRKRAAETLEKRLAEKNLQLTTGTDTLPSELVPTALASPPSVEETV